MLVWATLHCFAFEMDEKYQEIQANSRSARPLGHNPTNDANITSEVFGEKTTQAEKKLIDRFEYINAKGSLAFGTFNLPHKSSPTHATSTGVKYDEIDFIYLLC